MSSLRVVLALLVLLSLCAAAEGQTAATRRRQASKKTTPPTRPSKIEVQGPIDYSQEPFVFEQYKVVWRFENDGTGTREQSARIRVQSDAGVQALGQLVFGYNTANEGMEIKYVRVRKADGSIVTAPGDAAQDLPSPIEREAPVYTDFREKHVTVPGLRPGETLEYDIVTTMHTALVPGHFWLSHDFEKQAIVLDEELEVNVPKDRTLTVKTQPGSDPKIENSGSRRLYRWSSANLLPEKKEDEKSSKKKAEGADKPPAVQMTTFSSWEELGKFYAGLERDRVAPTPEIRAKAEELTRDKKTDLEKIEALYDYVATNFRYVSLSFGVGRLQPHPAAAILANQYGDCKDKHTLLAALLDSVGIRADAVLIPSQRKLDPAVPAPSQFDHMITAVPRGDGYLWMDTTTEVAPFQMLMANLRKKQAVVIAEDGATKLAETPADPPFPSRGEAVITGKVNELGKLEANVEQRARGDQEIVMRFLFRRTPRSKWEDLAQQLTGWFGIQGDVSDVQASDPANTKEPFELKYKITMSNYVDWSSKESQTYVYLPAITVPDPGPDAADSSEPIKIGSPTEVWVKLQLELPKAFTFRAPVPLSVKRDYGEYTARYSVEGNTFRAERDLKVLMRELPSGRASDYASFRKVLRGDEDQRITVESKLAGAPGALKDAKASELYEAALAAYRSQNFEVAAQLLKRVVELEPKHKSAWNDLGQTYIALNRLDDAVQALQKQIEAEPFHGYAYNNLGLVYWRQQKYDEAAKAFQKQLEVNPLDEYAHGNLGSMYCEQGKYSEAVPELETAISLKPDNPNLRVSLGQAYLNLNQPDKAVAAFDKAVEMAPSPTVWNNVAYQMAEKGANLDRAQQYAESAVAAIAASLRNVNLDHVRVQEAALVSGLGAYWDTLGWVHFKKGDLDNAEKYVRASWQLMQHGEVGDHLAQIYEKRGRKQDAIHQFALAMAAYRPLPETRARLAALLGDDKKVDAEVAKVKPELDGLRSVSVPAIGKDAAQADFLVLLSGPKADQVKFVRGDDKLQALAEALRGAKFNVQFPDDTPTKILRRGTVSCSAGHNECTFTMVQPDTVSSVN